MAKSLFEKKNYNPFRLTSEEKAEMDPNYKKPKKKVCNFKVVKIRNYIIQPQKTSLLSSISPKNPSENGRILHHSLHFFDTQCPTIPMHVGITHDQM